MVAEDDVAIQVAADAATPAASGRALVLFDWPARSIARISRSALVVD
ncbi:hypothetical protein [Mycobacterium sp. URHD0025]|nr:hypothetical protein [Mycobacterium sp. URHD0025]